MSELSPLGMPLEISQGSVVRETQPAPFDPRYIFYEEDAQEVLRGATEFAGPQIGWQWSTSAFDGTPMLGYFAGGALKAGDVVHALQIHGDYFMRVVHGDRGVIDAALNGDEIDISLLARLSAITAANCEYYRRFRQRNNAMGLRTQIEGIIRAGKMNFVPTEEDVIETFRYPNVVSLPEGSRDIIDAFQSANGIVPESMGLQVAIAGIGGDPLVRASVDLLNHHYPQFCRDFHHQLKKYMHLFGSGNW